MKKINTIILAILSIFSLSCNKTNSNTIDFNMEQTYWEGKYISTIVGLVKEYNVKITFKDEDNRDPYNGSSYTILDFNSQKEYTSIMHYKINKKIITISDSGRELGGDWWEISRTPEQLILQRNLESELITSKLIISRRKI